MLGIGYTAVVAIHLALILAPEPRFVTLAWPFLVVGGVLALESTVKTRAFNWAFGILTILYAQFWLRINIAPWHGEMCDGLEVFPKQIYFMHFGLWMSSYAYAIYLSVGVVSMLWLWRTIGPANKPVSMQCIQLVSQERTLS